MVRVTMRILTAVKKLIADFKRQNEELKAMREKMVPQPINSAIIGSSLVVITTDQLDALGAIFAILFMPLAMNVS
jgi:hypothetical protein